MNRNLWKFVGIYLLAAMSLPGTQATGQTRDDVPAELKPWISWALWDVEHMNCPPRYDAPDQPICFWPARLNLRVSPAGGEWSLAVKAFDKVWVPLPGNGENWPVNVRSESGPLIVVERDGRPSVELPQGSHNLAGEFRWNGMPQQLPVPPEIGLLTLTVGDQEISQPAWDAQGDVWLQRTLQEPAEQDALSVQVYRVLEDGIPLWLRTQVELTVSGRIREVDLGCLLPAGWQLSLIDSPLPVAVDDSFRARAQVRPGKWIITAHAFRTDDARSIGFATEAEPITNLELVGFQAQPEFRLAEISGLIPIDVSQTTYPDAWRQLPVFQWNTSSPFEITEKMRGMGQERPAGLRVTRHFWLDESGRNLTYHDQIQGTIPQLGRLDVASDHALGAVRVDGEGQLITTNPQNGSPGFEVRARELNMEAVGRVARGAELSAVGWQTDVDSLQATLTLPPGWRLFALLGADRVEGDWLTAWTLLDLFLLLIFALAVAKLWGRLAGLIGFLAFGLAYHEFGSPRYTWLFLLIPLALLRVVPDGWLRRIVQLWRYAATGLFLLALIPFLAFHIQSAIYPQLEPQQFRYGHRYLGAWVNPLTSAGRGVTYMNDEVEYLGYEAASVSAANQLPEQQIGKRSRFDNSNLLYDPQARIQTGPAQPQWVWNDVLFTWGGPVSAQQTVRPILIPATLDRILSVLRIGLLLCLTWIVLRQPWQRTARRVGRAATPVLVWLAVAYGAQPAIAQIPDNATLQLLRERLLKADETFPHAAEIHSTELRIRDRQMSLTAEIHAAADIAVPLPGRLPAWTPVRVEIDNQPAPWVCRRDGYLWVTLPRGIHQVKVNGLLPETAEWDWTYLLAPRRVVIDAPDWNITGVNPNGVPEAQIFFTRKQQTTAGTAAYDRRDFQAVVAVERHVEIGLVWQVRTEVVRLSSPGRALSLRIPLLPSENVITANAQVQDGRMDVRMAAGETSVSWLSELPLGAELTLRASETDQWVERWHLITSPMWNVAAEGLQPIYAVAETSLIPVWNPWPGESVQLRFSQPQAIQGDTVTVQSVTQEIELGSRQRKASLELEVESSLGSDFAIALPPAAELTSLAIDGRTLPGRRENDNVVVPLRPGKQKIVALYRTFEPLTTVVREGRVSLPVASANITTTVTVPDNRWVLWTSGPLRGPAVRFWPILVCAVLLALALGGKAHTPLRRFEWILLAVGLTQVHVVAAFIVVGWLFLLAWRGRVEPTKMNLFGFNALQLLLVMHTGITLLILVIVVGEGLLGDPRMFIIGNGSSPSRLIWFQPESTAALPAVGIVSVSVWFYNGLMLLWALWLAASLLRWLQWGWTQFSHGGYWKRRARLVTESEP